MPSTYDFSTLSPSDFELLVRDLLSAEYGWRMEAFGHGPDGGIDLRSVSGCQKIVVQCKHYAGSRFSDLRRAARREKPKIASEKPDRYIFVTSQDLSRTQKDTLADDLKPYLQGPEDLRTQLDLNEALSRYPLIEQSHFKLWLASVAVLERVVHSGLWARSEALMEDVCDRVRLYVTNPTYGRASEMLEATHVLVLSGSPGVGKSMLADMLALKYWHEGWQIVTVSSDIDEGWQAYQRERKQLFLYDDFLGQTDLSERQSKNEGSRIARFIDRMRHPDKRFIMTTRSQILRQAEQRDEPIRRGNFRLNEFAIKVSDYGLVERARILYNHLYFSGYPRELVRLYVASARYWRVVQHPNFTPRIVEQVLKRPAAAADELAADLEAALDHPLELWQTMFTTVLSETARQLVLSLAALPPKGADAEDLRRIVIGRSTPIDYTNALKALEGTWLRIDTIQEPRKKITITYANPSCRDFVLSFLDSEPDYFVELILQLTELPHVQMAMAYCMAEANGTLKYPRLAATVRSSAERVSEHIKEISTGLVAYEELEPNCYTWSTERFSALVHLIEPARKMMPTVTAWFIELATDAIREHEERIGFDPDDLHVLVAAVMQVWQDERNEDWTTAHLETTFRAWAKVPLNSDQVVVLARDAADCDRFFEGRTALGPIAEEAALENLREEMSNILYDADSLDEALQWLSQIEDAAHELGLIDQLRGYIEMERDTIFERDDEGEIGGRQRSSSGGGDDDSEEVRLTPSPEESRDINALFRHLG
ncbi:nSTAND3 domain-containing NTPase [Couchioplanes caeruleus]|uniref:Uncharacterized protein n=2 Tax=Couchioplanes caeruleus TaxID=56438 RepID=A0A1K0GUG9_9ACTN|nr:restriction endonuclease [Couchioplanes caeruleus]OJF14964.1 hypothetical protein BG844_07000 [Couchioplanes caeruleus subsp. caeruleus]ROP29515.1 restriction endonuclease [Couchioplanes caeruleus]